jgi:L,D-transpeptidase catalytic domain
MRWIFSVVLLGAAASALGWFYSNKHKPTSPSTINKVHPKAAIGHKSELQRLSAYSGKLKAFAKQNKYNADFCFLVDMRLSSGQKRFFIYDLRTDTILNAGLVTHGSGSDTGDSLHFSNTINSNCTSLGKYKIGNAYNGNFGLAYKLYGLDATNSNAYNRFVVLHSHACVPSEEVEPRQICESWGCPTVAPSFLGTLKTYLDKSASPTLLWIFY